LGYEKTQSSSEELSGIDGLFEIERMSSFKSKIKAKGYQVM